MSYRYLFQIPVRTANMKGMFIFLAAIIIHLAVSYVFIEGGTKITDRKLIGQGYVCQTHDGILLKEGEYNNNFSPQRCESLGCYNGRISHTGCPLPHEGKIYKINTARPYPECCG